MPLSLKKIATLNSFLKWDLHQKTTAGDIKQLLKIPLNKNEILFIDFPNTAMYSLVSYIPQAVVLFICKPFNLPPLYLLYITRLFQLLAWIGAIVVCVKIIPFYKWMVCFLALLPMSVFTHSLVSADMVTNAVSFLLVAYTLRVAFESNAVTRKNIYVFFMLTVVLALAKLVYILLILFIFTIPTTKFNGKVDRIVKTVLLLFLGVVCGLLWSFTINKLYLPYTLYNNAFRNDATIMPCADMHHQMHFILSHGLYFFEVVKGSLVYAFNMYFTGFIGTLGWLDTRLPYWFIILSYLLLLFCALGEGNNKIKISVLSKAGVFLIIAATIFLILLSQHLTWDCVGSKIITTIQGRYFIPIGLITCLLFYNSVIFCNKIVVPLVMLFTVLGMFVTIYSLNRRYYIPSQFKITEIVCGAETVYGNDFTTNVPNINLKNVSSQSDEQHHSGNHSIKLSSFDPYGFTYKFGDCSYGDILNISIWRFGTEGELVVSAPENNIYLTEGRALKKDSLGWEYIELNMTLPINFRGDSVGVFINNNDCKPSHFDDIKIRYSKMIN